MKILILTIISFAAIAILFSFSGGQLPSNPGAPVVLFTSEECKSPCADARAAIRETTASVEEVYVSPDDEEAWRRFDEVGGGTVAPLLVTRKGRYEGFNRIEFFAALADSEGVHVLPAEAQEVFNSHFENGVPKMVMYATEWCPYCDKARKYFSARGIEYEERDVEKNELYKKQYDYLDPSGYPLIYFGAKMFRGFDAPRMDKFLKEAAVN